MTDKKRTYEDIIKEHADMLDKLVTKPPANISSEYLKEELAKIQTDSKWEQEYKKELKRQLEEYEERLKRQEQLKKSLHEGFLQQKAIFEKDLKFKVGDRILILPDQAALQGLVSPLCWDAGAAGTVIRTNIDHFTGISIGLKLDNGKEVQSFYPNLELIPMDYNMELIYGKS